MATRQAELHSDESINSQVFSPQSSASLPFGQSPPSPSDLKVLTTRSRPKTSQDPRPEAQSLPPNLEVGLEELTANPTWKDMLYELVYSHGFDPWNIEIESLCTAYVAKIKSLKNLSLHVPANVILAASILLRLKSDAFTIKEDAPQAAAVFDEDSNFDRSQVPAISLSGRIPPQRRFTLDELTSALETVFSKQKLKEEKMRELASLPLPTFTLPVSDFDIDWEMEDLFSHITKATDSENLVLFSRLAGDAQSEKIIFRFLALLHLAQGRRVRIFQEKFFGEIFIQLPELIKSTAKNPNLGAGSSKIKNAG